MGFRRKSDCGGLPPTAISGHDRQATHVFRLIATIAAFITGGLFATGARWSGIQNESVIIAIALIGAGLQSLILILLYLYRTRPRPPKVPFGEPVKQARKD
jgi:type VI protein secretion system component VasK